jgi:hypothetical protein
MESDSGFGDDSGVLTMLQNIWNRQITGQRLQVTDEW